MDDRFIKKLLANMKCGICGRHYEPGHINILGHKEDLWFLSVFCPACTSQALVAAVIKEGKVAEVVTDLTEKELSKLSDGSTIEADDVLDLHNFLKGFEGDFSSLFSENEGGSLE
jgi:galactokinase